MKNNNKKPTTKAKVKSTDIKVSIAKSGTNKALQVSKPKKVTEVKSNLEVVEIQKFVDNQGVSFRNKRDAVIYQNKGGTIDNSSKFGVSPSFYYDTSVNFKNNLTGVNVVIPTDVKALRKASKNAIREAKHLPREAVAKYDHDMKRIEVVSIKNLEVARIEALRILTKAVIIEKNHHEQVYEKRCHEETIKNINQLKNAMIHKNDAELAELLPMLKHDFEVELRNNELDYYREQAKIEEKTIILQLKRRAIKKQIKELNEGQSLNIWTTYIGRRTPRCIISDIRQNYEIPPKILFNPENQELNDFNNLLKFIKNIDIKKLSAPELKIWKKFTEMINFIDSENKYNERRACVDAAFDAMERDISELKNNTVDLAKTKKFVLLSPNSKIKNVLAARKNTLFISKPARLYSAPTKVETTTAKNKTDNYGNLVVKTKVIRASKPSKIDPIVTGEMLPKIDNMESNKFSKDNLLSPKLKLISTDKISQKTSKQLSKLEASDMVHFNKLKFETIEYTNYKWEWKEDSIKHRQDRASTIYNSPFEYDNIVYTETKNFDLDNMFKGALATKSISKLQRIVHTLPEDRIITANEDIFKKEKLDVKKIIMQFKAIDTVNYQESVETNKLIEEIKQILKIYNELYCSDLQRRKNVLKAQRFDEALTTLIMKQDSYISQLRGNASSYRQRQIDAIVERYNLDIENTKNQHLLHQEAILQQEQDNLAKEEETYLWNSCLYYKISNDYANREYSYENSVINAVVKAVEKFNRHSTSPISLANIPNEIAPMPITSNARVDIIFETDGSDVYAVARHTDLKKELVAKISASNIPKTIEKIYVLDKFRAVKDIKTRVALLTEFANQQYLSAVQANKVREKREMAQANAALEKRLVEIDQIYKDAALIDRAADGLDAAISDSMQVQSEYERVKKQRWALYEKAQANIEKSKAKITREDELQNLKERKENERIVSKQSEYNRLVSGQKSNKAGTNKTIQFGEAPTSKMNKFTLKMDLKKSGIKKQNLIMFGLFNKHKQNEISIDEIIGKRK